MDEQDKLIDLNTASIDELTTLPGVKTALARRILEARPFSSLDDLRRVKGIDRKFLEQIKPHINLSAIETQIDQPEKTPLEHPQTTIIAEPVAAEPINETTFSEISTVSQEEPSAPNLPADIEVLPPEQFILPELEQAPAGTVLLEAEPVEARPVAAAPAASPKSGTTILPQPRFVTSSQALTMSVVSGLLSFILAIVFMSGLLALINGGLHFVTPDEFSALKRQVSSIESHSATLQQGLEGLRTRLDNLEGLTGRVGAVEKESKQLRSDLDTLTSQAKQLNQQVSNLATIVQELQNNIMRFQKFMDGLRDLLNQLAGAK